ncbi:VanZ family protein [Paenibacillus athensensis]|uniref:VanZ-like domain-containing protein n=1 Tax=Paenibacillus athensensis TaxID=1967502 RepID=A0A4Y8PVM2_9BACL|nr:VanZ family protein [Paenibacillus athensensis]MCD1258754.1 VanZ family protein [Paenibacillus athensensis]
MNSEDNTYGKRSAKHGRPGRQSNRRMAYRKLLLTIAVLVAVSVGVYGLGSIKGITTEEVFYGSPLLIRLAEKLYPESLSIPYKGKRIADREVRIEDPMYSGGTLTYTESPDARIEVTFVGSRIVWNGLRGNYSGQSKVYLDGQLLQTIDLYSLEAQPQAEIFASDWLTSGWHTLQLQATDQANPASLGHVLSLDYFLVTTSDGEQRLEDADPLVKYIHPNHYYYLQFLFRKTLHMLMYFTFTSLLMFGIRAAAKGRYLWLGPAALLLVACADEYHQAFIPGRTPSFEDVLTDSIGIVLAGILWGLLLRNKRRHAGGDLP